MVNPVQCTHLLQLEKLVRLIEAVRAGASRRLRTVLMMALGA